MQNSVRSQSLSNSPIEVLTINEPVNPEVLRLTIERDMLTQTFNDLRESCVSAICKSNMIDLSVNRLKNDFNYMGLEMNSIEADLEDLRRGVECKICLNALMDVIFNPCRHVIACYSCAGRLRQCPYCREFIQEALPIYF